MGMSPMPELVSGGAITLLDQWHVGVGAKAHFRSLSFLI